MNAINLCLLLLNTSRFLVEEITIEAGEIRIALESTICQACCPQCQQTSTSIHSTYIRYPTDLAWAEWRVILHLKVKRFFCQNPTCPKRTFAQQFPDFVRRYARRTDRVLEKQRRLGVNVCARIAEKLLGLEQIGTSDTTLNRIISNLPDPETETIRVLGVDDWAKRKGQQYGTILVDLERGQIVDLLGERVAEPLVEWLGSHPEIEIVSRDRSQTYADAIARGVPKATQVADRWHLLKNTSDVLFKIMQQEYSLIRKLLNPSPKAVKPDDLCSQLIGQAESLTVAEQRRKERIDAAQQLYRRGCSQKHIAQQLHIHPKTVRRYLRSPSPEARRHRTGRLLDPFTPYLLRRWNEGCHNATQLFREIQEQGFAGHATIVLDTVRQFRKASGLPLKVRTVEAKALSIDPTRPPPTLRTLTYWILGQPEQRNEEQEKLIEQMSAEEPRLGQVISQARTFASLIRQQKADELESWMEQAEKSGYRVWKNFAAGIKQDWEAVRAALTYRWSNGPTEGHINRLKCLKRQMYGRAKDDLLRKRVLWQGRWGFT
jgi:transposase